MTTPDNPVMQSILPRNKVNKHPDVIAEAIMRNFATNPAGYITDDRKDGT